MSIAACMLASDCGSEPSGPLDPALSAKWIQPSVDTYCELDLQQRGSSVLGSFGCFSAIAPKTGGDLVSGTAKLPHVVLTWTNHGVRSTFDATLSSDQQTLTGTFSPDGPAMIFRRELGG